MPLDDEPNITTLVKEGFTPESAIAAIAATGGT
jgi:hypothetical protein